MSCCPCPTPCNRNLGNGCVSFVRGLEGKMVLVHFIPGPGGGIAMVSVKSLVLNMKLLLRTAGTRFSIYVT